MYRPWAWWVRLDNYEYDESSYVYIDRKQRFGEHSKKELYALVGKTLKWTECETIQASHEDYKLFNTCDNLKTKAKAVYDNLRKTRIICPALHSDEVINRAVIADYIHKMLY